MPATIRLRIRERREAETILQCELAAAMGLTSSALSKLERGQRPMHLGYLAQIAAILACNPKDLFETPGFPPPRESGPAAQEGSA